MSFTVGTDSYVTVSEADEYIENHRRELDPLRVHWSVLTDPEKELYLRQSCRQIERVMFVGQKYYVGQKLAFPRRRSGIGYIPRNPIYGYMRDDCAVPQEVKAAQIENALGLIKTEYAARRSVSVLRMTGVISDTEAPTPEQPPAPLSSATAELLLAGWTGAGRI